MTVLHSITVVCPRLLTVGDSVVLFVFLFYLILHGAPAMSLSESVTLISTVTYLLTQVYQSAINVPKLSRNDA